MAQQSIKNMRVNLLPQSVDSSTKVSTLTRGKPAQVQRESDGQWTILSAEQVKSENAVKYDQIQTYQRPVSLAASKARFLEQEIYLIDGFYETFGSSHVTREFLLGGEHQGEWIQLINFPLPDYCLLPTGEKVYFNPDYENITVVIADYPNYGPNGIHIMENSANFQKIQYALGHIYDKALYDRKFSTQHLVNTGWKWLCFRYDEHVHKKWNFNPHDITQGDCLAGYFEHLFRALSQPALYQH